MDVEKILECVTEWCKERDGVRAVGLIGSAASESQEPPGDWDLIAFFNGLGQYPPPLERQAMWESRLSAFGTPKIHCCSPGEDRFVIDGTTFGVGPMLISDVEGRLDQVLSEADVSRTKDSWFTICECPEAICGDIQTCKELWDPEGLIQRWKTRVANYPEQFKLNIVWWVLLWARAKLQEMRRAMELTDIPLFHMALSDLCFCILRVLFALNKEYFKGPKRAFDAACGFRLVPEGWLSEFEAVLCEGVAVKNMPQLLNRAKHLTQTLGELAAARGPREEEMVKRAFFWWPDAEPMVLAQSAQQARPADADRPRG